MAPGKTVVKVRGLVKTAQMARDALRDGISPCDVRSFAAMVTEALAVVDRACGRAGVTPDDLAAPTRRAYQFLTGIDLEHLPLAENRSGPPPGTHIDIKNVTSSLRHVLAAVSELVVSAGDGNDEQADLRGKIDRSVTAIESICARQGGSPANLAGPSRQAYSLLKFLSYEQNLDLHVRATRRTTEMIAALLRANNVEGKRAIAQFTNMRPLWKHRTYSDAEMVQINEGFIAADEGVLRELVNWAFCGKSDKRHRVVRGFAQGEEFADVRLELDSAAELNAEKAQGRSHDLDQLFDAVNREYFEGGMSKPRLAWSRHLTGRKWGHQEKARDRVVISPTLDDERVPRFVVEFVLYHELLHRVHAPKWGRGHQQSHTPEFRRDERKFRRYDEAHAFLTKLATE